MIHVNGVSKAFRGAEAVSNVSMTLEPGKVTGLAGPNGSGKTMLMRMVAGLVRPSSGTIDVNGKQSVKISPFRQVWGCCSKARRFSAATLASKT